MSLSEYEKYKIYKDEEAKRMLINKQHEISEIDKEDIVEEYSKRNICLIDETKLVLPDTKLKKVDKIIPWISAFILLFLGLYYFILFFVLYSCILLYLGLSKGITTDRISAIIKCPTCHKEEILGFDRDSFEHLRSKSMKKKCGICNIEMELMLNPKAIEILDKNKKRLHK